MGRHHYREGEEPVPGYRLKRWLGEGGFGVAWMATAPGGTEVALKMIDLSAKNALKEFRALRLVKRIRHPNLTPILAFWMKDADGFILDDSLADTGDLDTVGNKAAALKNTMMVDTEAGRKPAELIIAMGLGDMSLSDRLEQCQAEGLEGVPPEELLQYMEDAARAIDHLNSPQHDLGDGPGAIQHCDIKPQNILIVGGAAQVCDFGLARAVDDTRNTKIAVSYAYAAPESFQNKPSAWTDQYSLAISYVELRTGELPFDDESAVGVMNAHLEGRLNLSRLPEGEREVIRRATALRPQDRYDSALKMVRALRRAYEQTAEPASGRFPAPPPATRTSSPVQETRADEIVPGYHLVRSLVRHRNEEVWEATAPGGKPVALVIRELADSAMALDLDALSLIPRLEHTHITELLSFWLLDKSGRVLSDEELAAVDKMQLDRLVIAGRLTGRTLHQCLADFRPQTGAGIPLPELLYYMEGAAEGIDFLNATQHRLGDRRVGIVHCNLQTTNLLLYGDVVKVGNFGRARIIEGDGIEDSIAAAGFDVSWTPPEVFSGQLTRWTDQYGLALAYVHLRTGKLPFDAASSTTRLIQMQRAGEVNLRGLPKAEAEVVHRATAIDPRQRYDDCATFVAALRRATGVVDLPRFESTKSPTATAPAPAPAGAKPQSKTSPIAASATDVVDVAVTAPYDTTEKDDHSVIETRPVAAEETLAPERPRTPGWQQTAPQPTRSRAVVFGGIAVLCVSAVAAVFALSASSEPDEPVQPQMAELTPTDPVEDESEADAPRIDEPDLPRPAVQDPFAEQVDGLLKRAAALPPVGDTDPQELLVELLALKARPEAAEAWDARRSALQDRIDQVADLVRQEARAVASERPNDALSMVGQLLELDPRNVATLLLKARVEVDAEHLAACRETLDALERLSLNEVQAASLRAITAQLELIDPAADAQRTEQALELASALFDGGMSLSRDAALGLCTAVAERCLGDDRYVEQGSAILAAAYRTFPEPAFAEPFGQLLSRDLAVQIASQANPDFGQLLQHSETLLETLERSDPLAQLCRAECLIETASDPIAPQRYQQAVDALAGESAVPPEFIAYRHYVESLVAFAPSRDRDWNVLLASLDELAADLASTADRPLGLQAERRRQRASEMLVAGAEHSAAAPPTGASEFELVLYSPYGDEATARRARSYLAQARRLESTAPAPMLRLLAHAAAATNDQVLAREAAAQWLADNDQPSDDRLRIALIHAHNQPDDDAGRAAALESYVSVLEALADESLLADVHDGREIVRLYRRAVQPALERASRIAAPSDEQRRQMAALYAVEGRLLFGRFPDADWEFDDAQRQRKAFEAYRKATELDDTRPEYLVGRGQVRWKMEDEGGAEAALQDVELALAKDATLPSAHKLRGYLFSDQARSAQGEERVQFFEQARESFEAALEHYAADDPERTNCLIGLCNAHVNLANYKPAEAEGHLLEAEKFGQEAVRDRSSLYLELAYRALGNAQEDLAWIVGRTKPEMQRYYQQAVDSFERAKNLRTDLGAAWRDLGRSQYKWAVDSLPDPQRLQDPQAALELRSRLELARGNLEQALSKDEELNDARYWLAATQARLGQYGAAAEQFDRYFEEPHHFAPYAGDWATISLMSLQNLHDAVDQGVMIDAEGPQERLQAARKCADRLQRMSDRPNLPFDPLKEARAIRALASTLEGRADEALEDLLTAIPDLGKTNLSDLSLLAARVHARLASSRQLEADESVPLVIRDAVRLASLQSDTPKRPVQASALAASSWAQYKAANFPRTSINQDRLGPLFRQYAILQHRALMAVDPHHPDGWMLRQRIAKMLKEEIDDGVPNAEPLGRPGEPATAQVLADEATAAINYAIELAPADDQRRLRRLKADLSN